MHLATLARRPECALFALVFCTYSYFYQGGGWNENSRFALVRSLVEEGSVRIDRYRASTGDKAKHLEHFYSDKAPGTSWLGLPAYAAARVFWGATPPTTRQLNDSAYLVTVSSVSLPAALGVVALALLLAELGIGPAARLSLAIAYGLATLAFPYATVFKGHQLAASLLIGGFWLIVRLRRNTPFDRLRVSGKETLSSGLQPLGLSLSKPFFREDRQSRSSGRSFAPVEAFASGCMLGYALAVEYTSVLAVLPLLAYAAAYLRSRMVWLLAGLLVPIAGLAAYNQLAFGGPASFGYLYSTMEDRRQGFFMGIGMLDWRAAISLLFSPAHGLLFFNPWLAAALPGAALLSRRGRSTEAVLCILIPTSFLLMNAGLVDWEGGKALGPRYLVPALPFLAVAVGGLFLPPIPGALERHRLALRTVQGLVLGAVVYSGALMLIATAVDVSPPSRHSDPLSSYLLPSFLAGELARSTHSIDAYHFLRAIPANRFAWNAGERLGLVGLASLAPLAVLASGAAAWLVWAVRRASEARSASAAPAGVARLRPSTALVALATGASAGLLLSEWALDPPQMNDNILHLSVSRYAAEHWDQHWAVDHWFPSISTGFPLFAHYPHLSHLVSASLAHALGVDAGRVYLGLSYLLLALLPLSIFVSLRKLGLAAAAAACAAALYPLLASKGYFGLGWDAYVWRAHGTSAQLWGTFFLFPALGWGFRAIRTGEGWYAAGLLLAACTLSHFLLGYVAALSLGVLVLLPDARAPWGRRVVRLVKLGVVTAATTAYFVAPFLLHRGELLRSRWEPAWKWNSMGWRWVIPRLLRGEIFDGDALPIISLCVAAGLAIALPAAVRGGRQAHRWISICFLFWIVLFFGRPTLGRLADVLPLAAGMHMHRFIAGVQAFGIALAGIGLATAAGWLRRRGRAGPLIVAAALAALFLVPSLRLAGFMRESTMWAKAAKMELLRASDFHTLVALLEGLPPGRVHAGFRNTWGKEFQIGGIPVYSHLQMAGFDMVGYLFMAMARTADWQMRLDYLRPDHCDLYNLRYILAPADRPVPAGSRQLALSGDLALYETATTGYFSLGTVLPPPSGLGTREPSDPGWGEVVYQVGDGWLQGSDPERKRFLSMREGEPRRVMPAAEGAILHEAIAPGSYACSLGVTEESDLILKVTHHPNWRCVMDGDEVAILPVFPGFMAVRVPAGRHEVHFTYEPPPWKRGLFVLALLSVAVGTGRLAWRTARARQRKE